MSAATGADVESLCNKCGDVWHVVVAMVGDKIAKVQCKQCGGYHRHRDPSGKTTKSATPRKRSATTRKSTKPAAPAKPTVEADMSKPIRSYSPREEYAVADRIEHAKFGVGVVQSSAHGKAEVFFVNGGRRVLATARPEPKLSRRPRQY